MAALNLKSLKSEFESLYKVQCTSYFTVSSDDNKDAVAAFKAHQVVYGSGSGYAGDYGDEGGLLNMRALNEDLIQHDAELAKMFREVAAAKNFQEGYEDLNFMLAYFLREANLSEMIEVRSKLFIAILKVAVAMSEDEASKSYLSPPNSNGNILKLIKQKRKEGRAYIKCLNATDEADQANLKVATKLAKLMSKILENCGALHKADHEAKYDDAAAAEDEVKNESEQEETAEKISKWLSSRKFTFAPGIAESSILLKREGSNANGSQQDSKRKLQRLKKEMAILSNSLPDGIFVKVDEDRFDVMRVLIVGPEGTPYENGCFLFDLFLPAGFPDVCPKMKFLTTGGGSFRFNPNLYADGKVCLSLLGTWDGPGWNTETSTLLQLLVSVQAMVLVDYPLENEPGYEGQADGENSLSYNKGIRLATLQYAMLWAFEKPESYPGFAEEAKVCLYANKARIAKQMERWSLSNSFAKDFCQYFQWDTKLDARAKDLSASAARLMDHLQNKPLLE
eukprot:TRINITY_DN802_c0_g1_i1.p1 TRINITY_DN802_c0_g1~~TRINITY_DN802_c0_g1_i1.p1  ORF type:complete len:508 (-),score=130.34 TRINITY_DN802_c0_g1_i1:63-1586(-)